MLKKLIISAAFCGFITVAAPAAAVVPAEHNAAQTTQCTHNHECADCEEEVCLEAAVVATTEQEAPAQLGRNAAQRAKNDSAKANDPWGGVVTIVAMSIVLGALIILSILFFIFGKISSAVITSKKRAAHGVTTETNEAHHDEPDSGEAIAAISMALAEFFGQGHDIEDTILTIKSMQKAYSPWNSKIYNMRHTPEVSMADADKRKPLK